MSNMLDLSKVDRIVTDLKFTNDLTDWANAYYKAHSKLPTNLVEISLFKEIVWDIKETILYLRIEDGEARFAVFTPAGKLDAVWRCVWEGSDMKLYSTKEETMPTELMESFTFITVALMNYIREYREEPNAVIETKERIQRTKKPKKGKGQKRVTYLTRKAIKVQFVGKAEKREWTRRAEAWTVKKHPRTYHRGTDKEFTIWIDPHVRGKGEITPKEYRP